MKNTIKFFYTFIKRDLFKPQRGNKKLVQFIFQSYWPVIGSCLISFILFMTGCIVIIIWNSYFEKLQELEKNPFSSSIIVEGFNIQNDLMNVANSFYFDLKDKCFVHENTVTGNSLSESYTSVVAAIIPYKSNFTRLLIPSNNQLFTPTKQQFEMISLQLGEMNNTPNQKLIENNISEWIKDNLILENDASIETMPYTGTIVSKYLVSQIFPGNNLQNYPNKYLPLLYGKTKIDLFGLRKDKGINLWNPLTLDEKYRYLFKPALFNIAKKLPAGDILVSKKFMNYYRNQCFNPCRPVHYFQIIWGYDLDNYKEITHTVRSWLNKNFGDYLESSYPMPANVGMQAEFIEKPIDVNSKKNNSYIDTISECNIRKIFELNPPNINSRLLSLNIYDYQNSGCDKDNKYYRKAFLYLNDEPEIINNIKELINELQLVYNLHTKTHHVMTLLEYRKNIKQMNRYIKIVLIFIGILFFVHISLTISLIIHKKMNTIGTIMAMGASKNLMFCLYLIESLLLTAIPLIVCLTTINYLLPMISRFLTISLNVNWEWIGFYSFSILLIAFISAGLSLLLIVFQSPYKLISYKV